MITQDQVKKLFTYRDGVLYWKLPNSTRIHAGDRAGTLTQYGYIQIGIDNKSLLAHRIIYLYFHGYIPSQLDHIDGNRINNKIENLRKCTGFQNHYNIKKPKNNKSGIKGVHWCNKVEKWIVKITTNGKTVYIGQFVCLKKAGAAISSARKQFHGEFANHG